MIDWFEADDEIAVMRELNNTNIVQLIGTKMNDTHAFLGMELCKLSLEDQLKLDTNRYGMEEWQIYKLMVDFLNGFKHMRAHGLVHLDIKPCCPIDCGYLVDLRYIFCSINWPCAV